MARHEFRVVLDGIELDPQTVARIEAAIRTAALEQLSSVDLKGDIAARIGTGGTQGIQVVALARDQFDKIQEEQRG
jgi:hypothetical protein